MGLDRWAQLGFVFLQLLLISSLPRGTVSDWKLSGGLMGSWTELVIAPVIIWGAWLVAVMLLLSALRTG